MFCCLICGKVYVLKSNLNRHAKTHDGPTANTCGICHTMFNRRHHLHRHVQNVHNIVKNTPEFHSAVRIFGAMGWHNARASVINGASPTTTPHTQSDVMPPTVIFPFFHSFRSSETYTPPPLASLITFCKSAIVTPSPTQAIATRSDVISPATTAHERSGLPSSNEEGDNYTENTRKNIKWKIARMQMVNTPGFIEVESSRNRMIVWYFRKNLDKEASYRVFLHTIESEFITKLSECVRINPIIYNLKLEATYVIPNLHNSDQNNEFKTSAHELNAHSDVEGLIDLDFTRLLAQQHSYAEKFSGFTLSYIDGLFLCVCEYTPVEEIDMLAVARQYSQSECC